MSPIVWQTRYGDTILVADPLEAAKAMIAWGMAQGYALGKLEEMNNGYVKVNIPGITLITLAPKGVTVI